MTYTHVHVSERPDPAGVVECTWATGVELARAALAGTAQVPPASAGEREALRASGGGSDTAGSTYTQLAMGLGARYGLFLTPTLDLPATEIPECTFLGVQGLASHLPVHYQRWDPGFAATGDRSSHSLVVFKLNGVLTICDPLAPLDTAWHGEPITWAAVRAYHDALTGAKVIAVKLPPETSTGGTDVSIATAGVKLTSDHVATFSAATPYLGSPNGASIGAGSRAGYIVPYIGDSAGFAAVLISTALPYPDKMARPTIVYVPRSAVAVTAAPVVPPAADTSPFTQADLAAAVAADRAKARITYG